MAVLFLLPAGVLWGLGWMRGRAACDQFDYHIKAILEFASDLPRPDLRNYASATTPGYHLLMAAVERATGAGALGLQISASVFTLGLLGLCGWLIGRAGALRGWRWRELAALGLPIVASPYVFTSGVWLLPDNAGWLVVVAVLAVSGAFVGTHWRGAWSVGIGCVLLVLTVLVRQSHLWVAAPFVTAAWLSPTGEDEGCLASALRAPGGRIGMTSAAGFACVPAVAVLGWFAALWHGLTPPSFQGQHEHGVNATTPAFFLALVGVFSPFFAAWWWPGMVRLWRGARWATFGAAAFGLAAAALPATTYLYEPRASGLWQVVRAMESRGIAYIGGRTSILILVLATIGAPMLAAWLAIVEGKRRWIIGCAIAAFVASQCANANCWQRYHEPLILILFALMAAGSARPEREPGTVRFVRWAGPVALGALLAAVLVYGLLTGRDPTLPNP
jgi:hypothetical protein